VTPEMPWATTTWPETHRAILDAKDAGFSVRVVGTGGIAYAEELQSAANIGAGLDPDAAPGAPLGQGVDADSLRSAIADALRPRSVCRFHVDAALDPAHMCEGALALEGVELACAADDGWWLESAHRIVLTGAACASLDTNPPAALAVALPCTAIDLPAGHCRSSDDCEPLLPQCDRDVCVECTSAEHCFTGEVCIDGACSSQCGDCTGDARFCDEHSGECVGCLNDDNCRGTGICDPDTRACTGCRDNADCLSPGLVCEPATGRCRGCDSSSECDAEEDCCDGVCIYVHSEDHRNCGGCGVVCEPERGLCRNGMCECGLDPPCEAPLTCMLPPASRLMCL
jgi:hypothetical protein